MKAETRSYPKRLIEVDLPIRRISDHARREKSIRHGHISTLHIWWARRPLAACRAVICASLWPDPADPHCPAEFIKFAKNEMLEWTDHERLQLLSSDSQRRFNNARKQPALFDDPIELRKALLDLIADFADWGNATNSDFLATSRALTQAAHVSLGGEAGTRPLLVDPFAGGGSIPLEALRVGADAFSSDLNPIPVLLNKVILEYIPKYGQRLADEVRKWGDWIKLEAEKELAEFYPKDPDGATPIAYLWARTIRCEGPGCGAEVPLIRSLWLAKKAKRSVALQLVPNKKAKRVDLQIIVKQRGGWVNQDDHKEKITDPKFDGTVKSGSVTCPCCAYTTPNAQVREQLAKVKGGASTARMIAVVILRAGQTGRGYRTPAASDEKAAKDAARKLQAIMGKWRDGICPVPDEQIPRERPSPNARGLSAVTRMGVERFGDLFTPRQQLALLTLNSLVLKAASDLPIDEARAVRTVLALSVGKIADLANSCCRWEPVAECPRQLFARQAVPIVWDFPEGVPIGESSGSWDIMIERFVQLVSTGGTDWSCSEPQLASATQHPLPNDIAAALVTDPPYYDAVPYGDLSDFFYVWLRRALHAEHPELFATATVQKDEEAIWNPSRVYSKTGKPKDEAFYELQMQRALSEARRFTMPTGIGVVVFAHKSTAGWEAILSALINAGWIATASWPVDTEMGSRVNAMGTASLASSVHIVCRPREDPDGSVRTDEVGDWRDVLGELPRRIHEWMPRLAEEGVVGADAIFACLGPALEIFSNYSRVEKASGEVVTLKEFLEHVWAAVSKEALSVIFEGASTEGFEPDARLTAMWLWTLAGAGSNDVEDADAEDSDEDQRPSKKSKKTGGFSLEYDAARKIAQGLGANLENLRHLIELSGDTARLLPVSERTAHLFGKQQTEEQLKGRKPKKKDQQLDLFAELSNEAVTEETWADKTVAKLGETTLDRVHQSMILFAANRGEALKRFLVEDGAGKDPKFWRLAQALSALYPSQTDEKRWVDGVLARKKGLGL
jgi:putative DNA methylase